VVIAIIALLASLLLPALTKAKTKAQGIKCLTNLRQVQLGWMMYSDDHNGALVPNGGLQASGKAPDSPSWSGGWLGDASDSIDSGLLMDPVKYPHGAKLAPYLKTPAVFKCPGDKSTAKVLGKSYPRLRSISMNYFMRGSAPGDAPAAFNYITYRKIGDIIRPDPASAHVFIDEREDSIDDPVFASDMANQNGIYTIGNYPASYHNNAGALSFADGHAEIKKWLDPRTRPVLKKGHGLGFLVPSPGNQDIAWLQNRTSAKK
jgi:prepilin-type processing-associated H-X9-DG protein